MTTLSFHLAPTAFRLGLFAFPLLGWFFEIFAHFHFTKDTLALHLLLERAQRLIDIIVAYNYFYHLIHPLSG